MNLKFGHDFDRTNRLADFLLNKYHEIQTGVLSLQLILHPLNFFKKCKNIEYFTNVTIIFRVH